jgi:quinolinate synthase
MRTLSPDKHFIEAPTSGNSATCKSCAHCPWMAMNGLANLAHTLETGANEIQVDAEISRQAYRAIDRMLQFAAQVGVTHPTGDLSRDAPVFHQGMGPA